jgi:hypothetical protein
MTRRNQLIVGGAIIAAAVAVSAYLWHNREQPVTDNPASQAQSAPSASSSSSNSTNMDPQIAGQIRDAYQKNLADNAPPGMLDLMQGDKKGSKSSDGSLPPLPDPVPVVIPAGHQSTALPPLPGESGTKAKEPAKENTSKETEPKEPLKLPPLDLPNK